MERLYFKTSNALTYRMSSEQIRLQVAPWPPTLIRNIIFISYFVAFNSTRISAPTNSILLHGA